MNQTPATAAGALPADLQGTPVPQPSGIKGWLLIPALMTLVAPLAYAKWTYDGVVLLTAGGLPTSFKTVIAAGMIFHAVLVPAWVYAAYLLLKRKRQYPPVFIALLIVISIYVIINSAVAVFGLGLTLNKHDILTGIRTIGRTILLTAYMLHSERVRNTFVR